MNNEIQYFDVAVTFHDHTSVGICIPTDITIEEFAERTKTYNSGMVNVDVGSSRHRTLLMGLIGLDKDALFRRADFYAVTAVDVTLTRSLALPRG